MESGSDFMAFHGPEAGFLALKRQKAFDLRENLAKSTVACELWPWQSVGRRSYAKKDSK